MNCKIPFGPEDYDWFFNLHEHSLRKHRAIFLKMVYKKLFDADTPLEAAMALMEVDTPVELALKVIQTDEQRRELLERLEQTSHQTATASA